MESVLLTVRSDDSNLKICSNVQEYFIKGQKSDYPPDHDNSNSSNPTLK